MPYIFEDEQIKTGRYVFADQPPAIDVSRPKEAVVAKTPDPVSSVSPPPLIPSNEIEGLFTLVRENAGPELENKVRNAASIAATYGISEIDAFDAHDGFVEEGMGGQSDFWKKATGSITAGFGDLYAGVGGILKRGGYKAPIVDQFIDFGTRLQRAYIPPADQSEFTFKKMLDPEWYATTIARSVPFSLSLIPAALLGAYVGSAVGSAVGLGLFGKTILGSLGGAALSRPNEAAFEAQSAYEEAKKMGLADQVAADVANQVFLDNLKLVGLDFAQLAIAFLPIRKVVGASVNRVLSQRILAATGRLSSVGTTTISISAEPAIFTRIAATSGKLAAVGAIEMGEERYQEKSIMDALGQDASFFDFDNPRLNEAGAAGLVFGVGLGGAGSVWSSLRDKVVKDMPSALNHVYNTAKEAALDDGAEVISAEARALDAVAGTPEGKAHIERAITDLKDLAEGKPAKEQPLSEETAGQPLIIGVKEDADGVVTGFIMADPLTGQVFEVGVSRSGDGTIFSATPDMTEVSQKLKELREPPGEDIDTRLSRFIDNEDDIDAFAEQFFGKRQEQELSVGDSVSKPGPQFEILFGPATPPKSVVPAPPVASGVSPTAPQVITRVVSEYKAVTNKIESSQDLAQLADANIGMQAQENLIVVYTDADGQIIKVMRHSLGTPGESLATPSIIVGGALNTPGAVQIWVAHNHPAGSGNFSEGDLNLSLTLDNLIDGTDLRIGDFIAVGNDQYASSESGTVQPIGEYPAGAVKIPVSERVFIQKVNSEKPVSNEKDLFAFAMDNDFEGIVFTDNKNRPTALIRLEDFSKLRGDVQNRVLAAIEKTNSTSMAVVHSKGVIPDADKANLRAFAHAADLRFLDIIDAGGSHRATGASLDSNSIYFYSGIDPTQIVPVIRSIGNNLKAAWPHLEALGMKAYVSGKTTFRSWSAQMKSYLGDLWESFKGSMAKLWDAVKSINARLGERGYFPTKDTGDVDVLAAIAKVQSFAKKLGVRIDKIEVIDEEKLIDHTTPEGRQILIAWGMTEKEIQDAIDRADRFRIAGEHWLSPVTDTTTGQRGSNITLWRGHTAADVYHEFGHAVQAYRGIRGSTTQTIEQQEAAAALVEHSFLSGKEEWLLDELYVRPTITDTSEFKEWFGDSKVLDAEGNPLVVYSGHSNIAMYGDKYDPDMNRSVRTPEGNWELLQVPVGSKKVTVVKNPVSSDITEMRKRYNEEFPNDKSGTPKTRTTIDEQGNKYVWMSGDATHSDIEAYIKKEFGLSANQNGYFDKQKPMQDADKDFRIKDNMFRDPQLQSQESATDVRYSVRIVPDQSNANQIDFLADSFKAKARMARAAMRAGNPEQAAVHKKEMRAIIERHSKLLELQHSLGLTNVQLNAVVDKNPMLMDGAEFAQYLRDAEKETVLQTEHMKTKLELIRLIQKRQLKRVDNYRNAMNLPEINDMTTAQLRQFIQLLEPFQFQDVFLTQRELETVDRTDVLHGTRTYREVIEIMTREIRARNPGFKLSDLEGVKVAWNANWKWDSALREQDPFYQLLVHDFATANMAADLKVHAVESMVLELSGKAHKSRKRSITERMIPIDVLIFSWLEASPEEKAKIAEKMTSQELDFAHFVNQYFAEALDYLLAMRALSRGGIAGYIAHIRKTFLENVIDKGLISATREMFVQMEEEQMVFNILDDATGDVLPLEKFFRHQLTRSGAFVPSRNVTNVFMTYVRLFERKKMYDALIPKLDIYAQVLTPMKYTPRGLEIDATLKTFVKTWINNKKGRHISFNSIIRQGGPIDVILRASRTFISLLELGLFVPVQLINVVGEQVFTFAPLGAKDYARSIGLIRTEKGKRILDKYEAFTGRSFWENFTAPGKQINERFITAMFAIFHVSTVAANKQFLLASMTEKEWAEETLSEERLASIKLDMGRFRAVPGDASILGSTSLAQSLMQYKTWAVSPTRTLIKDLTTLAKDLKKKKFGEALTTREAREVYRIVGFSLSMLMLLAVISAEENDDSILGKMKARAWREIFSMTAGTNPMFWLSWRTATFLTQLASALSVMLEKPGRLLRVFTPGAVRQITDGKEEADIL